MDKIISQEHHAFIQGRHIADNILLGHELIHSLNLKKTDKNYGMALKLDVSKAYECVEWTFLHHMMRMFGFHERWIHWIM